MTDQSMAIDDGSSTCRKKVMLQLLTAYMNLLGNIWSGRKTRWKQNNFLTWISTLSKSSFTQLQYIMKFFCIDDNQFAWCLSIWPENDKFSGLRTSDKFEKIVVLIGYVVLYYEEMPTLYVCNDYLCVQFSMENLLGVGTSVISSFVSWYFF